MNKLEALHVAVTAFVREMLREDPETVEYRPPTPAVDPNTPPEPRLDFDESNLVCEHGGVYFAREECPVHGPSAQEGVTAEELDDITTDEVAAPIQRAHRIAEQRAKAQETKRLFPEDLPMSGMGPPPEEMA